MFGKVLYVIVAAIPVLMGIGIFFATLSIEIAHKIQEWLEGDD